MAAIPSYVSVTATDDQGGTSDPVGMGLVVNFAPVAGTVALSPDPVYTMQTLHASPSGFSDPDGNPMTYHYAWTCNGNPVGTRLGQPRSFRRRQRRRGRSHRGERDASDNQGGTSGAATDSVVVTAGNAPPVAADVFISPDPAYTNDTLTATPSHFYDPDNDALTYHYEWTSNGNPVGGDSATLDLSVVGNGDRGDTIAVEVYATDGNGGTSGTGG